MKEFFVRKGTRDSRVEKAFRDVSYLKVSIAVLVLVAIVGILTFVINYLSTCNYLTAFTATKDAMFLVMATAAFLVAGVRIEIGREKSDIDNWLKKWEINDEYYIAWNERVVDSMEAIFMFAKGYRSVYAQLKKEKKGLDQSNHYVNYNEDIIKALEMAAAVDRVGLQRASDRLEFKLEGQYELLASDVEYITSEILSRDKEFMKQSISMMRGCSKGDEITEDLKNLVDDWDFGSQTIEKMCQEYRANHRRARDIVTQPYDHPELDGNQLKTGQPS